MDGTLTGMFGGGPPVQPDDRAVASHAPGTPEPTVRTVDPEPNVGFGSPALLAVILLGLAILLTQIGFRASIEVDG